LLILVTGVTIPSISRLVREIVFSEPMLTYCIASGIVNYSKLAKKIQQLISELLEREVSVSAVKMALIRIAEKVKQERLQAGTSILNILARSSLEVRTGITIITLRSGKALESMNILAKLARKSRFMAIMQSVMAVTIVLDNETAEEFIKNLNSPNEVLHVQKDHAAVVIVSPQEIMYVPGVLAYITSILAQNDVNIVHIESCYTDTIIIVSKKDLLKAFQILSKHIEAARKLVEKPHLNE